jgi:signal peptidase II
MLRGRPFARALAVAVAVLAADQVTKQLVRNDISFTSSRQIIPGVLSLVHEQNSGIAFSLLTGSEAGVIVLTLLVVGAVLIFFSHQRHRHWMWLACGLVVGGALGNLLDRLRQGSVTDFIKVPHWPAFNLADTAITLGVLTLFLAVGRGGAPARTS